MSNGGDDFSCLLPRNANARPTVASGAIVPPAPGCPRRPVAAGLPVFQP
ncbi:MAG: hypothetical protein J6X49_02060 [Victivallales bacterium]|nr:hypothetical protein [Victivallales bacterium]